MLRKRLANVNGTDRDVREDWWRSRRLLVAEDGLPYSFHVTLVHPGARLRFEHASHRETVYCIAGSGTMRDISSGEMFIMERGSLYTAGIGEPHEVVAETEMTLVCVFDPPLEGTERQIEPDTSALTRIDWPQGGRVDRATPRANPGKGDYRRAHQCRRPTSANPIPS